MKLCSPVFLALIVSLCACDLERIPDFDPGTTATKFKTTLGGSSNEFPSDILANPDGSFIIVGRTQSFTVDQNNQAYIVKLDKDGVLVDQNNLGYAGDDWANSVVPVSDGGYIMVGRTYDPISFDGNLLLVKVNSALDEVWKYSVGTPDSSDVGFGIIPVSATDFIVGYTSDPSAIGTKAIKFRRINANGSKVSEKVGLTGDFSLQKMIKTSDNKIVATGYASGGTGTDAYIVKFDEDGDWIWDKTYPEPSVNYNPTYGVVELSDRSLVTAGSYLGSNDHDFLVLRYTEIGMPVYDNIWGGANADELFGITTSQDGDIVCVGYSGSFSGKTEIYVSKRSAADGSEIWVQHFDESWAAQCDIALCPDGGFVLCTGQNEANADIIVVKTDQNGNYE